MTNIDTRDVHNTVQPESEPLFNSFWTRPRRVLGRSQNHLKNETETTSLKDTQCERNHEVRTEVKLHGKYKFLLNCRPEDKSKLTVTWKGKYVT